jgi:hypothetical protein
MKIKYRKLNDEGLLDFLSLSEITRFIKSRRICWKVHVARVSVDEKQIHLDYET